MKEIAIIIVSFGRSKLLKQTLESLFATREKTNYKLYVVDNASGQQTLDVLIKHKNRIDHLVLLNKNQGKPYAWNLGVSIAKERCKVLKASAPDYYLFCDNDLLFHQNWQQVLLDTYEEHRQNHKLCGLSAVIWPPHLENAKVMGTNPKTQMSVYRYPPGCCVLMSKEAYSDIGNWDTTRLIRTVDTSYFRNAFEKGYINGSVYPTTLVEHTGAKFRSWHNGTGKPKLLT